MRNQDRLTRANVLMETAQRIEAESPEGAVPYGALADLYMRASSDYYEAGTPTLGESAREKMVTAQNALKANPQPVQGK